MTISQRIFDIMEKQGKKQNELSEFTGLSTSAISAWKKKGTNPGAESLSTIADFLGVTLDYLLTGKEKSPSTEKTEKEQLAPDEQELLDNYRKLSERDKGKVSGKAEALAEIVSEQQKKKPELVPLYYVDNAVSAGLGANLSDYEQGSTVYVPATPESRRADFVLRVSGDSMEPRFYDGDYVLVRSQPVIDIGQIGIFGLDGSGYIKKLGENCLISLNTRYKPIPITENTVCFGLVLGTTRIIEK